MTTEIKLQGAREYAARVEKRLKGLKQDIISDLELLDVELFHDPDNPEIEKEQYELKIELALINDVLEEVSRAWMEHYLEARKAQ